MQVVQCNVCIHGKLRAYRLSSSARLYNRLLSTCTQLMVTHTPCHSKLSVCLLTSDVSCTVQRLYASQLGQIMSDVHMTM